MNALEKAKAFATSTKAKTALRIMPLALAAAGANASTAAQANFGMYLQYGTPMPEPSSVVLVLGAAPVAYYALRSKGNSKKK